MKRGSQSDSLAPYFPLLRHYSVTEGLMRGTGLINFVIVNATFAFLPGFGIYGLILSNALQNTATGLLQFPLGWLADRFGWAKAVIICFITKVFVTLSLFSAVVCNFFGLTAACWTLVVLHAVLEAFSSSLADGAYEAAFTEWYQIQQRKLGLAPSDSAPPLFIRSLRYSTWLRIVIPIVIVTIVAVLQLRADASTQRGAYTPTFTALGFVLFLRFIVLARMLYDLLPVIRAERLRLVQQTGTFFHELVPRVWLPVRTHFAPFFLFTLASFQYWFSHSYIAGLAMQQIQLMSLPRPYDWLVCVSVTLTIYLLDCLFWIFSGFRMDKSNAVARIRGVAFVLLLACLATVLVYWLSFPHAVQSLGFSVCTLTGLICGGAIKRFVASHIREWLPSVYVASWMSLAQCVGFLSLGMIGVTVVSIDKLIADAVSLLTISAVTALLLFISLNSKALAGSHKPSRD